MSDGTGYTLSMFMLSFVVVIFINLGVIFLTEDKPKPDAVDQYISHLDERLAEIAAESDRIDKEIELVKAKIKESEAKVKESEAEIKKLRSSDE